MAWLGLAWLGLAWLGLAWLGLAWLGLAWLGLAWLEYHNEHKRNAADTEQKYMRPIVTEPFETFHDFNQMCDH